MLTSFSTEGPKLGYIHSLVQIHSNCHPFNDARRGHSMTEEEVDEYNLDTPA